MPTTSQLVLASIHGLKSTRISTAEEIRITKPSIPPRNPDRVKARVQTTLQRGVERTVGDRGGGSLSFSGLLWWGGFARLQWQQWRYGRRRSSSGRSRRKFSRRLRRSSRGRSRFGSWNWEELLMLWLRVFILAIVNTGEAEAAYATLKFSFHFVIWCIILVKWKLTEPFLIS
jgi:hypothetical protein